MLKGAIDRADVGGAASGVLLAVAVLFFAIAIWAVRAEAAGHFERAGRLPLEDEIVKKEIQDE